MWQAVTSPFGIMIIVVVVALLAIAATLAVIGLRTISGSSRKARKADALRKIEEVNRAGYLDDVGTIRIDAEKQRRHVEGPDD
jgi:type II secretory pathway pseudopilin PulG